jgi:hypothetical protein
MAIPGAAVPPPAEKIGCQLKDRVGLMRARYEIGSRGFAPCVITTISTVSSLRRYTIL